MVNRIWLLGIILGIPLIGFGVSEGIQAYSNSELRTTLRQQFPEADRSKIEGITIDRLCDKPSAELADLCSSNANLNLMSTAAVAAGIVGLTLLLAIRLGGFVARGSRNVLLYTFKPGLYFDWVGSSGTGFNSRRCGHERDLLR